MTSTQCLHMTPTTLTEFPGISAPPVGLELQTGTVFELGLPQSTCHLTSAHCPFSV